MKVIIKFIYYLFFENVILLVKVFFENKNFLILTPRFLSIIIKKIYIYNFKNKKIFSQRVRNKFDINTTFQVFGYEEYNLTRIKSWKKIKSDLLKNSYKKKPLIIDCGANIGSTSRYFSEVYENALVFGIEPDKKNFEYLKINSNSKNIISLNSAVASNNSNYKLLNFKDPRAYRIKLKNIKKKPKKNSTITIKDILKKTKKYNCWPFMIKIDIEGFEENLFKKNFLWMNEFKIIVIEIHDWMIPNNAISHNFINALSKIKKRDLIINGENLISLKI